MERLTLREAWKYDAVLVLHVRGKPEPLVMVCPYCVTSWDAAGVVYGELKNGCDAKIPVQDVEFVELGGPLW